MREKKEIQTYLFNLRSFFGRNSLDQERKFIYSTKATHGYKKGGLGGVLKNSFSFTTLQEVGIPPTLIYFPL